MAVYELGVWVVFESEFAIKKGTEIITINVADASNKSYLNGLGIPTTGEGLGSSAGILYAKNDNSDENTKEYREKKPIKDIPNQHRKDDIPSWAKGEKPYKGEDGNAFAKRILDQKYGQGKWPKGAGTEHSQLKSMLILILKNSNN